MKACGYHSSNKKTVSKLKPGDKPRNASKETAGKLLALISLNDGEPGKKVTDNANKDSHWPSFQRHFFRDSHC